VLCDNPFIWRPAGVSVRDALINCDARDALVPFGCGQCLPCRKQRASVWKHRIMLEASVHEQNLFITLTYNDESVPKSGSLFPRDATLWLKRYRKAIAPREIRYFLVGEYGNLTERPHYHIVVFNGRIEDEQIITTTWDQGFVQVSELVEERAAYICKYVVKSLGRKNENLGDRYPEFMRCSKQKGGLGKLAVEGMIERLKQNPHSDKVEAFNFLQYGKAKRPLGRYLRDTFESSFPKAKSARTEKYEDEKLELIKHLNDELPYKDSLMRETEGKRQRLHALENFYRKRGQL